MDNTNEMQREEQLRQLCATVRTLVLEDDYEGSEKIICKAMEQFPNAPHPHNLMGIILEKTGNHLSAMKHFRAAWALDPTYLPANHNLRIYGTFFTRGGCAFDESDLPNNAINGGNTDGERSSKGSKYT